MSPSHSSPAFVQAECISRQIGLGAHLHNVQKSPAKTTTTMMQHCITMQVCPGEDIRAVSIGYDVTSCWNEAGDVTKQFVSAETLS